MSIPIKHILFVDADREAHSSFNGYFDTDEIIVHNFKTAMGAIQHIKESQPADILIIDEHIKPMGAEQTINYLIDELHFKNKVLVCSETKEQFVTNNGVYEVLKKPLIQEEYKRLCNILGSSDRFCCDLYSLDYLKELSDGDKSFIAQSVKLFVETVGPRVVELTELLSSKKYQEISDLAHNIKPSFEMILNKKGAEICDFLAHHAKPNEFENYVLDLKEEFELLEKQLHHDFAHEENW